MADNEVKDIRKVQVTEKWQYRGYVPLVQLKGKWLASAGFEKGQRLIVQVERERIIINLLKI